MYNVIQTVTVNELRHFNLVSLNSCVSCYILSVEFFLYLYICLFSSVHPQPHRHDSIALKMSVSNLRRLILTSCVGNLK